MPLLPTYKVSFILKSTIVDFIVQKDIIQFINNENIGNNDT